MLILCVISTLLVCWSAINYCSRESIKVRKEYAENQRAYSGYMFGVMIGMLVKSIPVITIWLMYFKIN